MLGSRMMNQENLYQIVKEKIYDQIFKGNYEEGDRIPSERELAETLEVSRVTIRRSLEELEAEKLILREVGRGTRITLHNWGNQGELDMIVLVAPAKNPFFAKFIAQFQSYAETKGSLLLYVEKPRAEDLEDCLYRLYKRGLRNVVIWLEDLPVDLKKLKRLRAIGMNMVFFDSDKGLPYGDCVTLDNQLAIRTLYEELERCGYRNIGYAGWNLQDVYSIRERERAYIEKSGCKKAFLRVPWEQRSNSEAILRKIYRDSKEELPEALICSDREMGEAAVKVVKKLKLDIRIASVDEVSKGRKGEIITYQQDLGAIVKKIFACLKSQCEDREKWKAQIYQIEGILNKPIPSHIRSLESPLVY